MTVQLANTEATTTETLTDLMQRLGDVPFSRIRLHHPKLQYERIVN